MTKSQLEKIESEQLVKSFLILGNQTELLQQYNPINERLGDLSKKLKIFWMKIIQLKVY